MPDGARRPRPPYDDTTITSIFSLRRISHANIVSLGTYLHIGVRSSLFSDGPITIHTTHYPEACWAGPGTLSLAHLIRRNDERIRLQGCRPTVVDVSLHNWQEIVDLWKDTLDTSDDEALKVQLDLLNKLAHDLRTTFAPSYVDLLEVLLRLLPRLISAPFFTALLATLSGTLKHLLVPSIKLDLLDQTWTFFEQYFQPAVLSSTHRCGSVGSVLRRLKSVTRQRAVVLMAQNLEGVEDASVWIVVFACESVSQTMHTLPPSSTAT
ncbi:hypothetical protein M405DRAFT_829083 [Rhizopogon salebrosus TDB-379]|nr:hypothetical protein M405DRAFT_829083 [Rhizopogon salebrosus TDB-379]